MVTVFVFAALVSLTIAFVGTASAFRGGAALEQFLVLQAVLLVAGAVTVVLYVAGEDDDGGTSRWDAYDSHAVVYASVASTIAALVLLAVAWRAPADARRLAAPLALVASVAVVTVQLGAVSAHSLN